MTKDKFLIGFYWRNRQRSIRQVAASATELLSLLKDHIPEYKAPEFVCKNGKVHIIPIEDKSRSTTEIEKHLLKEAIPAIKKYHPGAPISSDFSEQVGFVFGFRAESTMYKGGYSITCAMGSSGVNPNLVIVKFPKAQENYDFGYMKTLFTAIIACLDPDYAFIASKRVQQMQKLPEFFVGWMSYFYNYIQLPPIPDDFEVENVGDHGKIIITTQEEFDAVNNDAHYEKAMRLAQLFREHGLRMDNYKLRDMRSEV